MTFHKRSKRTRQRGSHTHGWGAKKKHRGSGHIGGTGMAGTGKRAQSKKPSIWKDLDYFGKHGFIKKNIKVIVNPVNVSRIDETAEKLVAKKLAQKGKDGYEIKLADLGLNKLLGSGKVRNRLRITALMASKKAVEAVRAAGGEVTVTMVEKAEIKEAKGKDEHTKKHSDEPA